LRDGQSQRLRRFQIEDLSEPRRLLDRQVGGIGAFQYPVGIAGGAAEEFRKVRA
jgi:hypothetical protein